MAGGTFDISVGKVRPGTYINVENKNAVVAPRTSRGVVIIPISGAKYGAKGSIVEVTAKNADMLYDKLGFSVYESAEPSMILIREALKNSTTVKAYILNEGEKATVTDGELNATAICGGSRGNDLKVAIIANPVEGFDIKIYLGDSKVEEFVKISKIEDLINCNSKFVAFSGTGELSAKASLALTGGTDGDTKTEALTAFLDELENIKFNAVAFPMQLEESQIASVKSKIKYLRNDLGKTGQFVFANCPADFEGVINVTNGVVLDDGTKISAVMATAYVAGITAGANYNVSNTYKPYVGAVTVNGLKTNEEAEDAIRNGELFFSFSNSGEVVIEYDINSLTSKDALGNRPDGFKKNRYIRVIDTLMDDLQSEFTPGKFDNNPEGWDLMEGRGYAILKQYESDNAIADVDYDNDFLVDRTKSTEDGTYITAAIKPLDSAEKIYITVKTV